MYFSHIHVNRKTCKRHLNLHSAIESPKPTKGILLRIWNYIFLPQFVLSFTDRGKCFFLKKWNLCPCAYLQQSQSRWKWWPYILSSKSNFYWKSQEKKKNESQRPDNMLHSTFHNIAKLLIDEALRTTVQIKHTL